MKKLIDFWFRGYIIIWYSDTKFASGLKPTTLFSFVIFGIIILLSGNYLFLTWWKVLGTLMLIGMYFLTKAYPVGSHYVPEIPEPLKHTYPNWYIYL